VQSIGHKAPLLCSPLLYPITSSFLGPNIMLSALFSNTLNLLFLLSVTDRQTTLHAHAKTTGKIFLLYSFSWVIHRRLNFMCRRFGTFCSIFIGGVSGIPAYNTYQDRTECSETSAHTIQKSGNHPKERTQHSKHGEILKLRKLLFFVF